MPTMTTLQAYLNTHTQYLLFMVRFGLSLYRSRVLFKNGIRNVAGFMRLSNVLLSVGHPVGVQFANVVMALEFC